jgi:hypothetical protein
MRNDKPANRGLFFGLSQCRIPVRTAHPSFKVAICIDEAKSDRIFTLRDSSA